MRKKIKKVSVAPIDTITGSIVDTFNVDDKTTNAPSLRLMIDLLYPIGRGFIDFTDTDYSNWLGLTWERELVGMFPVGYKSGDADFGTIGKKGGEKTHTLTEGELPKIDASVRLADNIITNTSDAALVYNYSGSDAPLTDGVAYNGVRPYLKDGNAIGYNTLNYNAVIRLNLGNDEAHNNLPPYQVVSYWKRVDPNAKKMISFIIYNLEFQAEQGMTWQEWVNSSYNTDEFYISGNFVYSKASKSISSVTPTDVIISGKTYYYNSEK